MKTLRKKFTDAFIRGVPCADDGRRYDIYDEVLPGLTVRVNDKAKAVFYVYKKMQGRPVRIKLGDFTMAYGVEKARKDATDVLNQINHGTNPNDNKRRVRADMTLKEFWNTYYMPRHGKYKRPKTQESDGYGFNKYLEPFHRRKMLAITQEQVDILHKKIGEDAGIYVANRAIALLRNMYNKSLEWGCFTGATNPAERIKMFKVEHRDRFIQPDEMQRLFDALNTEHNEMFKNFVMASLLTGQRRRNVQEYRWADIDFENQTLYIKETKNGQPLRIPLTRQAMELFTDMKQSATSEWLFPSATSKTGHLEEPKKMWAELLKRAEIKNLRIHDLRRTYGSYQAIAGSSMLVIGKSLGHKSTQSTEIYARLSLDPIRESVQSATDKMMSFRKSKK